MRTTLEIEDDVLASAKELAKKEGLTLGEMLSRLARQSLPSTAEQEYRNGIPLLPVRPGSAKFDLELVNRLRDEE